MKNKLLTLAITASILTANTQAFQPNNSGLAALGWAVQQYRWQVGTTVAALVTTGGIYYWARSSDQRIDHNLGEHELLLQKLLKQYQELMSPEKISAERLHGKFTTHEGTQHARPSIADYHRQLHSDREQIVHLQEQLSKDIVDWKAKQGNRKRITRAENIIHHTQMFLQATDVPEQLLQTMVPVIDHAVTYYGTKFNFKELLHSNSWQLDAHVRSQFRDDQFPYPHIKCVNRVTAVHDRLHEKEEMITASQPLKQPSMALRGSLQALINNVVNMSAYREQQHARLQHESMAREAVAREKLAHAEQERARAQEQAAQELRRKNDIAQQQLDVARTEQARLMAESIAHTPCKAAIEARDKTIAARDNQIRACEKTLQEKQREFKVMQEQAHALHNAYTQQEQDRKHVQQVLVQLNNEVTRPPFNPASDESVNTWFQKIKAHVQAALQRDVQQAPPPYAP